MHASNGEGELLKIQRTWPCKEVHRLGGNIQIFLKSGGSGIAFHEDNRLRIALYFMDLLAFGFGPPCAFQIIGISISFMP